MDPSRRHFLKFAGLLAGGAVGGYLGYLYLSPFLDKNPGGTRFSTATSASYIPRDVPLDYAEFLEWLHSVSRPYSGQTIKAALEYEPTPLAIEQLDLDFYNSTGINDLYDIKPYSFHLADLSLMVRTGSPTYDVFDVDHQDVGFFKDHIFSPTELAEKYPDLTYSETNSRDFQESAWSMLATYPPTNFAKVRSTSSRGKVYFIPFDMDVMIEYYRKDIFSTFGLPAPRTWDEYFVDVKTINNSQVRFGTVNQGGASISVVYEYLNHLTSFGGKLWNFDGEQLTSALDGKEALAALENYVRFASYSDPSSGYYGWEDVTRDLTRGIAGTALQFSTFEYYMNDPLRSQVVGKITYNNNPAGPAGSFSTFAGSGLGVSRYSKHPQAAWLWLQWATSLGAQREAFLSPLHAYPAKKAVFNDSSVKEALQRDNYSGLRVAKSVWDDNRVAMLVPFPKWVNVLDPLSLHLSKAVGGFETPQTAISLAQQQIASWGRLAF